MYSYVVHIVGTGRSRRRERETASIIQEIAGAANAAENRRERERNALLPLLDREREEKKVSPLQKRE